MTPLTEDFLHKILNTDPDKRFTIDQIRSHDWYKKYSQALPEQGGIYVGYSHIEVDNEVL